MKTSHKLISAATLATLAAGLSLTPANAHIGIRPGVDSAGSTVSAITAGQAGVLVFRVGHGCTVERKT
jgi:uncharacterized protein YcnI